MPFDVANLPKSLNDYERIIKALKPCDERTRRQHLRFLCQSDLFFLLAYGCNRADARFKPWLFDRCREVQKAPDGYIDLWSREHYKSTIITFALTIFDILNDPEVTFGIFSHTRPNAKKFLQQIKREFENNLFLKQLFPDILWENPARESPKWSEDEGIIVKRKTNPPEATIEAWGLVDGQPTGRHFKKRVYDDVVTLESVSTPEQIGKTTAAWGMSDNLGVVGGVARHIGTRYSLFDTYKAILDRKVAIPRIYPATHNGRMDGVPVFFSQEEWERRLRTQTRKIVAAQLLQNPMADEDATFKVMWLKPYEVRPRTMNVYIMGDPSRGRSATSDNTAMAVVGVAQGGARFLLDGYCHRMTLSQRWIALRDLYIKWSRAPGVIHIAVGYERYGAQSDDEYFQEQMLKPKMPVFEIQELNWTRDNTESKTERVERLEPDFRNGRFYLPIAVWREGKPCMWKIDQDKESKTFGQIEWREAEGLTRAQMTAIEGGSGELVAKSIKRIDEERRVYDLTAKFIEEYSTFPFGERKDLVDATSRLYDMGIVIPERLDPEKTEPRQFWDS